MSILDLPVLVTGDKAFSGTVTLERDDTSLGTFNGVDLGDTISAQAFIDEDNSFPSADTFSSGKKEIWKLGFALGLSTQWATHPTILKLLRV